MPARFQRRFELGRKGAFGIDAKAGRQAVAKGQKRDLVIGVSRDRDDQKKGKQEKTDHTAELGSGSALRKPRPRPIYPPHVDSLDLA